MGENRKRPRSEPSDPAALPDGIGAADLIARGSGSESSIAALAILGGLVLTGLSGLLGDVSRTRVTPTPEATVAVTVPERLRNGEVFEIVLDLRARAPMAEPEIFLPGSLVRDWTINTVMPAPAEEISSRGGFLLTFEPGEPAERLTVKIDAQVNPHGMGAAQGEVAFSDGDTPLVTVPLELWIWP